jgi:pyruvate-ferredoxin/flavodoxin oxidoreductase
VEKSGGQSGFSLDSKRPTIGLGEYISGETRFSALQRSDPERAQRLLDEEETRIREKCDLLERLANS